MESEVKEYTAVGLNFSNMLGLVFIVLKLCGIIDWSWWFVTMPFWAGLAVAVGICVFVAFVYALVGLLEIMTKPVKRK